MSAELLKGKPIADGITEQIEKDIAELKAKHNIVPSLASVLVGDDPASKSYAGRQQKSAAKVGIDYQLHELSGDTDEQKLMDFIEKLNRDDSVNGTILQMPLPKGIVTTISWELSLLTLPPKACDRSSILFNHFFASACERLVNCSPILICCTILPR